MPLCKCPTAPNAGSMGRARSAGSTSSSGACPRPGSNWRIQIPNPVTASTAPTIKKQVPPIYPAAAKGRDVPKAHVELDAIVMPDGSVGKVRVAKSLDAISGVDGFDAAAIAAAKQWTFEPGKKDGSAVPVLVRLIVVF